VHRLIALTLLLLLATAACDDGGAQPPSSGGPGLPADRPASNGPADEARLVFDGASYRSTGSRPMGSLASSDLEELGRGEGEEGAVDVFGLPSEGAEWEVVTRSGGSWLTWEPVALHEARHHLSQGLGVPEGQVSVDEIERVEWPDACLGVAGDDEVCAEVVTPGFRIVLLARGGEHVYHSDLKGNVRRE
jgi:hypothetical protein